MKRGNSNIVLISLLSAGLLSSCGVNRPSSLPTLLLGRGDIVRANYEKEGLNRDRTVKEIEKHSFYAEGTYSSYGQNRSYDWEVGGYKEDSFTYFGYSQDGLYLDFVTESETPAKQNPTTTKDLSIGEISIAFEDDYSMASNLYGRALYLFTSTCTDLSKVTYVSAGGYGSYEWKNGDNELHATIDERGEALVSLLYYQKDAEGYSTTIYRFVFSDTLEAYTSAYPLTSSFNAKFSVSSADFTVPSSITALGPLAFEDCDDTTKINLGPNVSDIKGDAFKGASSLKEIAVDGENGFYCSNDGVLYDKAAETLYSYPAAKEGDVYVTPSGVYEFGDYSFNESKTLKGITVPTTVEKIWKYAFDGCENLETIYLMADSIGFLDDLVIQSGNEAFENAEKLFYSETDHAGAWRFVNDIPTRWHS